MEESTHGVVYFTFGTVSRVETIPKETILAFYSSFGKIAPVRILMKIKDKTLLPPGLPENVKILSWLPQIQVLGLFPNFLFHKFNCIQNSKITFFLQDTKIQEFL